MRKDDYVFIRTNHEGRKLLKMYAAKHNITMLDAVVVLAKEALEREEKKGCWNMVHALPLALAMMIIFPFIAYLVLNDIYKKLSKWLDSKPNGNKEDEKKIIKYTIVLMVIMYILKYIMACVGWGGNQINYKIVVIISVIATMLVILIPDEKTMLAMLTLSFITPDNVVITENHIIDLITKIMDAVNNR